MDCKMSDMLIMKYMDGELSENEAKMLNAHILDCEACRKEFYLYDSMIKEFEAMPEICAPDGFELEVMAKVTALNHNYATVQYKVEHKTLGVVLGVFSVILACGAGVFVFREPILNSAFGAMLPEGAYDKLINMSGFVSEFLGLCAETLSSVFTSANSALTAAMGVVVLLIVVVAALQGYILYKRRR